MIFQTPREIIKSSSFMEDTMYLDPISGRIRTSLGNVATDSINQMFEKPCTMVNSSFARLRDTNVELIKNTKGLQSFVYNQAVKNKKGKTQFKISLMNTETTQKIQTLIWVLFSPQRVT